RNPASRFSPFTFVYASRPASAPAPRIRRPPNAATSTSAAPCVAMRLSVGVGGHDGVRAVSLLAPFSLFSLLFFSPGWLIRSRIPAFATSPLLRQRRVLAASPADPARAPCPRRGAHLPVPGTPRSPPPCLSQAYAPFSKPRPSPPLSPTRLACASA